MTAFKDLKPQDIEAKSFEIIQSELTKELDPKQAPVIMRCIHTSADFEYQESLYFSEGVIDKTLAILKTGAHIITDTNMARAGINKQAVTKLGLQVSCFVADDDVAAIAKQTGTTRSRIAVDKAAALEGPKIFVVGNAPTALIRIYELIQAGRLQPELVIGAPVGFVNVVESKNLIMETQVPQIVNRGRNGGSNIAAAIVNALMYMLTRE